MTLNDIRRQPSGSRLLGACILLAVCVLLVVLAGVGGRAGSVRAEEPGTAATSAASATDTPMDGAATAGDSRPANRLAGSSSPYLLQHAHNPVDWYPWGPEALAAAKNLNRPIFLSIGYSSCHWCHVMERLVFENKEIARLLNQKFICIKVDREERPDLDDIYMTSLLVYLRAIGSPQGGGWPLSMFLTSDGRPFAGGTYFPPEDSDDQPGFLTIATRISGLWEQQRKAIEQNADVITAQVRRNMKPVLSLQDVPLERKLVTAAAEAVVTSYDPQYGGFDFDADQPDGPKFPVESRLTLLQYAIRRDDSPQTAEAVYATLDRILQGGIHDHLGGGFHRYSTDRQWQVPHFEKMLYNQAQLASIYTEAWRRTGRVRYRRAAEGTLDFVLRELTAPEGGFYSSLDAETGGVEGQYYVWNPAEVARILGEEEAPLFARAYGLDAPSSFEPGHVLALSRPLAELAEELGVTAPELDDRLARSRQKLLAVRNQRESLRRDDKILTAWNGLMIAALARSGQLFDRPDYLQAAEKAALFLGKNLQDDQGRLLRTWRAGKASLNAYLDDYAFFTQGLLALHQATGEAGWLNGARRLTDQQITLFGDGDNGGYFFTPSHHEELLTRTKNAWDSALPAGNGVAVRNLIRLASFTGTDGYRTRAEQTLAEFAAVLKKSPSNAATLAVALGEFLDNPDFSATVSPQRTPEATLAAAASSPRKPAPVRNASAAEERSSAEPSRRNRGLILQVAGEAESKEKKKEIVRARAFLDVDRLPAGGSCRIVLFLDIDEPWHINANPAMPDFLVPTELTVASKQGIRISGLRYPPAQKATLPGFEKPLHVYSRRAILFGTLTIPRSAAGRENLVLKIRYQACDDARCLPPKTIELAGEVPLAPPGERVKKINENLFPRPQPQPR